MDRCKQRQFNSDMKGNNLQCLIMGLRNVGKSAVIQRLREISSRDFGLVDVEAPPERPQQTDTQPEPLSDPSPIPIQFSEASQFPFSSIRRVAISTSDAFVLIYAVDDQESFDYVTTLLGEIIAIKGRNIPLVVVANKKDLETRHVHPVIADCVVTIDFECKHREVNALSGEGVKDVLSSLLGFYLDYDDLSSGNGVCNSTIKDNLRARIFSMFRK